MTPEGGMIVSAIIKGERAWTSARKLVGRFGEQALAELERAGWIEAWSLGREGRPLRSPAWTLTAWAAERLSLVLAETEGELGCGVPYWTYADPQEETRRRGGRLMTPSYPPPPPAGPRILRDAEGLPVKILGEFVALDARLGRGKVSVQRRRKKGRSQPG